MHILFITHYYEPDSGAAAVRLTRLAKQLHSRGHQVTVLAPMPHYPQGRIREGYRGRFSLSEERDGIRVIRVWLWATPKGSIIPRLISQLSFMLACALRGLWLSAPDVIFIENQPVFTALAGWFISKIKRAPYLANVSDFWPEYLLAADVLTENHPLYRVYKALVNLTQKQAGAVVALYPPLLESIKQRIGDVTPGHVIYNAVDLERFHPDVDGTPFREKYNLGEGRIVSFVGLFGPHIDFKTMLGAAALLHHRDDVRFVLVGTGSQREFIEEWGSLEKAQWIEWVDHDEMPAVWGASYLTFWAVENNELDRYRMQAKLFEAMASGVPAVIAVEGLMGEVLRDAEAGVTVAFNDDIGLATAIEHLLDNEAERERLSRNARVYAEENFNPQRVADAYEDILKHIAED